MSGIAGFYDAQMNFKDYATRYLDQLNRMEQAMKRRGPDGSHIYLGKHGGLVHTDLNTSSLPKEDRRFQKTVGDAIFSIAYDGEIYNKKELRRELLSLGWKLETESDGELLLTAYLEYGPDTAKHLNGAFAFAILDPVKNSLLLVRDRSGIKPLFFAVKDSAVMFASEPKGIFACPGMEKILNLDSFNQVFSLGPARTPGNGVYQGLEEVRPAHFLLADPDGIRQERYWTLESHPHEDSYETTIEKTSFLVRDAVLRQMEAGVPVCTFLSGGIDSSLVSAICAGELKKRGERLTTYSFDFTDNDKNFRANVFQPSLDRPYVDQMVAFLDSDHHYLECDHLGQADRLITSVLAHDLPAMGDVDSSMLYFCQLVQKNSKVALTGECADEIFGGYPWFHKKESLNASTFPWTMDLNARKVLLKDDFVEALGMDEYVKKNYEESVAGTPRLAGETGEERRRREIAWLNLQWFMQTLLNRMDRTSAYCGLAARVPFADHRIIEYLWNVPWDMKARDGIVKNLLRQSSIGMLPDEVLFRKKSPYPKTYDTRYEKLLVSRMEDMMKDDTSPVMEFLDRDKVVKFLKSPSDYGKPWYGQLMAAPQMMAYMLQVNEWMKGCEIRRT